MSREPGVFPFNDPNADNLRTSGTIDSTMDGSVATVHQFEDNLEPNTNAGLVEPYVNGTSVIYTTQVHHNVIAGSD